MILLLFFQIEWQTVNRPYSDTEQELAVYLTIPSHYLKSQSEDSLFFTEYEKRIIIYDKKGNQVTGDYWETKRQKDTTDIIDSVKIIIPKTSKHFDLTIIDLYAGPIFNISGDIIKIKYIGNIQWDFQKDTLFLRYSILNQEGRADSMFVNISGITNGVKLRKDNYEDTMSFYIGDLANDKYTMKIKTYSRSIEIDEVEVPIRIARPFFLDHSAWQLKVKQLRYIASPNELNKLENSERDQRDSLWHAFWKQHDPTPTTDYNEKEIEYFGRIEYCEENFSHGDRGWQSDRARIYVTYGPPDEKHSYPYHSPPKNIYDPIPKLYDSYVVWLYYSFNRQYVFGDKHGLGEYLLLNPGGFDL